MENKKIHIIEYIYILVKWRKLIIINFFILCFFTAIFSLIMPKTYTAKSVLMPPQSNQGTSFAQILSDLPVADIGLTGMNQDASVFLAIIESRSVLENAVKKFELKKKYGIPQMQATINALKGNIKTELREDGLIDVSVSCKTSYLSNDTEEKRIKQLAADITNYLISELDRVNREIKTKQARHNRIFIEKRYEQNKEDLVEIEKELREFQEKNSAISLPEQIQAAISAFAEIKAEIVKAEVELGALKSSLNKGHPRVKQAEAKIKELRNTLNDMKYGKEIDEEKLKIFPDFQEAPELGVKYIRIKRKMEAQNLIYKFLTQQYEQAKLQEAKDTPTVQILDPAIPPEIRSKPRRSIMVILAAMVSILGSLVIIIIVESVNRMDLEEEKVKQKYQFIINNLNTDLKKIKFWNRKK